MFRTDAWKGLARRADAGEAAAFTQIADYMQANLDAGDSACSEERIDTLRGTAERLSAAGPPNSAGAPNAEPGPVTPPSSGSRVTRVSVHDGRLAVYRRVLRQAQGRFRRCYQAALSRGEAIAATALEFTIAADGHVGQTSFDSSVSPFERCMDATLKSLRFPEDSGRIVIRYPLTELPR